MALTDQEFNELTRLATRRERIDPSPLVQKYSRQYGVDPALVMAVIEQESGYNPYAVSTAGAAGLGQLMPATNRGIAEQLGEQSSDDDRFDPDTNIRRMTFHLAELARKYGPEGALQAYKAGESNVGKETYDPYVNEYTSDYVRKVLGRTDKPQTPQLPSMPDDEFERLLEIATSGTETPLESTQAATPAAAPLVSPEGERVASGDSVPPLEGEAEIRDELAQSKALRKRAQDVGQAMGKPAPLPFTEPLTVYQEKPDDAAQGQVSAEQLFRQTADPKARAAWLYASDPERRAEMLAALTDGERRRVEAEVARIESSEAGPALALAAVKSTPLWFLVPEESKRFAEQAIQANPSAATVGTVLGNVIQTLGVAGPVKSLVAKVPAIAKSPVLLNALSRMGTAGLVSAGQQDWKENFTESLLNSLESAGAGAISVVPEVLVPATGRKILLQLAAQPLADALYGVTTGALRGREWKDIAKQTLLDAAMGLGFAIRDVSSGDVFRAEQAAQRGQLTDWLSKRPGAEVELVPTKSLADKLMEFERPVDPELTEEQLAAIRSRALSGEETETAEGTAIRERMGKELARVQPSEPDPLAAEVRPTDRPAPTVQTTQELGDVTRDVTAPMKNIEAELDAAYEAARQADKQSGQAGAVRTPILERVQKSPAATSKAQATLEAGREQAQTTTGRIVESIKRGWSAMRENFAAFKDSLENVPQFRDDYRTEFMPMRRRHIEKIAKWRYATFRDVFKEGGKEGLQRVTDALILRNLAERGRRGMKLPNDLTVDEVRGALTDLQGRLSDAEKAAVERIRRLLDAQGQELVARGKMPATRDEYFPHIVLDYKPDWLRGMSFPMRGKFGDPYRPYTKRAVGSKRLISTSDEALWRHIAKVELDNAQSDWMLGQAQKYDATLKWAEKEAARQKASPLYKNQRVTIDGEPYRAIEWKKNYYPVTTVNKGLLDKASENDMLVNEWLEMRGPRGGEPTKEGMQQGRPTLFLVPENVARTMDNLIEKSSPVWDIMYGLGRLTQGWKALTIHGAGLPYQVGNWIGDTINLVAFDPGALKYMGTAEAVARKLIFSNDKSQLSDFEQRVFDVAKAKDVAQSGMYAELRRSYPLEHKAIEAYNKVSEYREAINRIAILAHQMHRVEQGLPVERVANINIEGLDPQSAAAKVAREAMVDYVAVPRLYQLLLSRGVTPFVRFHEANFRNHLRAATGKDSAMKYWGPVVATYAAGWAWNNLISDERKDMEMQLPDYIRNRWHLTLFKSKDGSTVVWAPQQPVDMAASWVGLDNLGRILSDVHGGKITKRDAAKEFITSVGNGWRENSQSLMNPMIQAMQGLMTNEDPFTKRKIMPDAVYKLFQDNWMEPSAARYVVGYLGEKLVTPIAQYSRTQRGDEPTTHPVWDWLKSGPLNVKRAFGFYEFDPERQAISETYDDAERARAQYELFQWKVYDEIRKAGKASPRLKELKEQAAEAGLSNLDEAFDRWTTSPKAEYLNIDYQLRNTTDESKRLALQKKKRGLAKQQKEDIQKGIPRAARKLSGQTEQQKRSSSSLSDIKPDIKGEIRRDIKKSIGRRR